MSAYGGDGAGPRATDDGDEQRRCRLVALLDRGGSAPPVGAGTLSPSGWLARLDRVCVVAVSEVGVDGAGITVMGSADAGRAGYRDLLAATGPLTRRLEELQLAAGEGPCLDAYAAGRPVLAGDLAEEANRWLGFGREALDAGAAAAFSLPLQVGVVRLGTLDMHRTEVGALSRDQLADALTLAALATETLLELDTDTDGLLWPAEGWLPDVHADVHVASGMVSAQAGIDPGTALVRIRAHAFASGEPINDVARRIIARDLFLDDPSADPDDEVRPSAPEYDDS